ncbi:hypothetical protein O6H91_Y100000 [Diphasiastrum complanatum]|nr:hypothetical protein O6H91_Y100000 [Diphasiastrum complanatum]
MRRNAGTLKMVPLLAVLILGQVLVQPGWCSDTSHDDAAAPKHPGCDNPFELVKVRNWVDGDEERDYVGISARFGTLVEDVEQQAHSAPLTLADPLSSCSYSSKKLTGQIVLVERGNCTFTTKAHVAQAAGAIAILIKNNKEELYKMVCDNNDTYSDIHIPSVMLPKSAGSTLENALLAGKRDSREQGGTQRDYQKVGRWRATANILHARPRRRFFHAPEDATG